MGSPAHQVIKEVRGIGEVRKIWENSLFHLPIFPIFPISSISPSQKMP
jgi:hypothetical protein